MKVTTIGHAGMLIETKSKVIVCDPWMSNEGAFYGSWHQWPRNDRLGSVVMNKIMNADYIYVSHMHRDHFDELFLKKFFANRPDTPLLLPGYSDEVQRRAMGYMGAKEFIVMPDRQEFSVDDFRVTCIIDEDGTYAGRGDSGICVADNSGSVLNQNDAKLNWYPDNIDLHFTQFSGAIWYPMVYRKSMDERTYLELIQAEVLRREKAFIKTITASAAKHAFGFAGPPVFLRDSLRWLNEPGQSIFYDQPEILEYTKSQGIENIHMIMPGSVVELNNRDIEITHPNGMSCQDVEDYFTPQSKAKEIEVLAQDRKEIIRQIDSGWPEPSVNLGKRMSVWLNPILKTKKDILKKIGFNIVIGADDGFKMIIDWQHTEIRELRDGDLFGHSIILPRRLLELAVSEHIKVWTSEIFLTAMFEAWREGDYNSYVYDLFAYLG